MDGQIFVNFFSQIPLNWLDYLIIIVLLFYAYEGFTQGFYAALLDFVSFILAFISGLTFYSFFSGILMRFIPIPQGFAKAIGFFIAAFLTEIIVSYLLNRFIEKSPIFKNLSRMNKGKILDGILGIFPSVFSALLLLSFILTMIITLPVSAYLKHSVSASKIGNNLVKNTQGLGKDINNIFGGAVDEGIAFFTVEPKSDKQVNLNFRTEDVKVDESSEKAMFEMVNNERQKRGVSTLVSDDQLTDAARKHCKDMFARGYFSHNSPEGYTPFDRMVQANIVFTAAGENLALAPNVDLAHDGLMKSPGHRENILSPDFGKIGVGVIDSGIYGQMFCQEFTN